MAKSIVAALIGAVGGAVVLYLVQDGRTGPLPVVSAAEVRAIVQKEEAPLVDRLDQLLRVVEAPPVSSAPARVEAKPPPPPDLEPITSRIDALEAKIDHLLKVRSDQELAFRKMFEPKPVNLRESQRAAMDRSASEKDRIDAFKALRGQKTEDGQDARSHDVILSIVDVAENSVDEDARLDVYRNLHGANDPAARDSMLRALAHDTSIKVRMKVAEDLDTFVDDPLVQRGLRAASDNDADGEVRRRATMTLAGKRK